MHLIQKLIHLGQVHVRHRQEARAQRRPLRARLLQLLLDVLPVEPDLHRESVPGTIQGDNKGFNTGNGEKLSYSQATGLACSVRL